MLLQCAIVEDVGIEAQNLAQALQAAAAGRCELRFRFYGSGDALLGCPLLADFDVVFLDICMPGTDGVETAARLRAQFPQLPIIFVTSSGDFIWQALRTHPFDYLLKPFTPAAIEKLLDDLLRAAAALPPEQRRVEVSARMLSPAMLALIVENTCAARPEAAPSGEGIGLTSVQTVVQRHAGQMTVERGDGLFRVNLLFNL